MKKGIATLAMICLLITGCNIADDIEYDRSERLTFEVQEVKFDDLLKSRPELKERSEKLKEIRGAQEDQTEAQAQSDNKAWKVTTGELNVRSEATIDSEVIGEVSMGDVITEIGTVTNDEGETWIKFLTGDGTEGYVNSAYLSKETDAEPIGVFRVVIPTLNIRQEPNEDAEILGELAYFNEFSVFEKIVDDQGRTWLKLQASGSPDGFGYVLSDLTVELEQ